MRGVTSIAAQSGLLAFSVLPRCTRGSAFAISFALTVAFAKNWHDVFKGRGP
jgi:hypothetical protein